MNFSTLRLRPYQIEAQEAIVEARKRGFRAQLVSLATGLGKTVVIATLPELLELRANDVTLIVAHRDELISQLVEKMKAQNPDAIVGVEKADETAAAECTIVVATVQTLTGPRLTRFVTKFGRRIALFVIDEAHHAAAPTYRAILDKILLKRPDALVLGFTATPQRGDGVELNEIFPDTVYQMDARAAITAGYLVPVKSYAIATDIDLDAVASRAGDFVLGQLADAVDTEERNRAVVAAYQSLVPGKKTLVFSASVEHARHVAELFKEAGVRAAFASGETPHAQREAIVAAVRGDDLEVLVNCGLYLEGLDVPSIEVIINARPTKSTTLYTQVTGRGLRPLDEDAFVISNFPTAETRRQYLAERRKPYATVIDIVDRVRRHELVTLPTLWGMPAQIDAQGRLISALADQYEDLFRLAPREAAKVRTAEAIENALIDAETEQSKGKAAAWQMISSEHWRLERKQRIARDRKGRPIPHFAQRFDRFVRMAQRTAPKEDPETSAMRLLDVDRRSMALQSQTVDVVRSGDAWRATFTNGRGPTRNLVSAPTLPDAIAAATARLEAGTLGGKRARPAAAGPAAAGQPKRRNHRRWGPRKRKDTAAAAAV